MKAFLKKHSSVISTLMICVVLLILVIIFKPPCLIRYFTGISCPSCGITRALFSLIKLDFLGAFAYQPLWFAIIPVIIVAIILHVKKKEQAFYIFMGIALTIYVGVWIIRLIVKDPTVTVNIENGAIYRFFVWIWAQISGLLNT